MAYKVIVSEKSNNQLDHILAYVIYAFCDEITASKLYQDYIETIKILAMSAESHFKYIDGPLKDYYKIHFRRHKYIILYKVKGKVAYIERIHHDFEDYEKMRG